MRFIKDNSPQFARFVVVGICTTIIHYLVLRIFYLYFSYSITTATTIAFTFAVVFSYFANRRITFGSESRHLSSIPKFAITTLIGLALNIQIMRFLVETKEVSLEVAFIIATTVVMLSNFALGKYWVFRQIPKQQTK